MKTLKLFLFVVVLINIYSCKKKQLDPTPTNQTQTLNYNMVVAKDGSGNYTTIQAAINAAPLNSSSRIVIFVKNGTYVEDDTIPNNKINLSIIGESVDGVKLTYGNGASKINPATGTGYGTGGSATLFINGRGLYMGNMTIANSAGPSYGPALAVNINGDKTVFNNCKFLGMQDTWYAGNCRVYLKNCYIEGSTDFIFGSATAYFDGCSLYSYGGAALTAANTSSYVTYGLVFNNCKVTGATGMITDLGRTWGGNAATAFVNCSLSSIVSTGGWNDWGNTANDVTARYCEYGNTGAGAVTTGRVTWDKLLTSATAANYTSYLNVLKTTYSATPATDNWDPMGVINAPSSSAIPPITTGATYVLLNRNSGKALDVTGVSTADGATLQQWSWGGGTNQQFVINDLGNGYFNLINVNSNKSLDVKDASTADLAIIQQISYTGTNDEQFSITGTPDGYFKIVNRNSGKCIEVKDASTSNGAAIQQNTIGTGTNQQWQINLLHY